jgi:DNA repair photolyase
MAVVTKLRWELADRPAAQSATKHGGQSTLFEESVFDREPGIGEYRGLEFLHVKAQRIINEVKGAPFGFSHTINAYRGCSHACSFCFARPTHEYLELDADRDFESKIVVKVNAASLLERELRSPRWSGDMIAMGTNTDPYQRAEGKYRLTRGIIEVLIAQGNPFSLLTKSTLVLRDLGLLAEAAKRDLVRVNFSIPTLDEDVWRATEPGTPPPQRRIRAVERLNQAGVPCGVLMAPVLPHISDRPEQLDKVVRACVEAGARSISAGLLHLRAGVKEVFLSRLGETHPELLQTYISQYRNRVYAPRADQSALNALIRDLVREHGGPMEETEPSMRATPVDPPPSRSALANRSDQLSLL